MEENKEYEGKILTCFTCNLSWKFEEIYPLEDNEDIATCEICGDILELEE